MDPISEVTSTAAPQDLLVASNRLPVLLRRGDDGSWRRDASSGGLITALEPVLHKRGGTWVGWPGVLESEAHDLRSALGRESARDTYRVEPVALTKDEHRDFYLGFCNEVLWPLFHGLLDRCRFSARYWEVYRSVNRKYADAIVRAAEPGQFIWVHDYHLMAVGAELRRAACANRSGFFLHIPFPAPDLFERLPWCRELIGALLAFDQIGFQTRRDYRNFLDCVRLLRPVESRVHGDLVLSRSDPERPTRVGVHPISIEQSLYWDGARTETIGECAEALRAEIGSERILLGVDRLDYTKGIPEKLDGFERALERYPDLRGRVTLVQLVIPSRERISDYHRLKNRIDRLVGRINGRFTRRGWVPVLYQFGSWPMTELLAFYRAADVALVTPLRDGMNLVSKEYVAASVERGALVLSEFAGSADELKEGALIVNPHDREAMAEAVHHAVTLPPAEQIERLALMQARVREHDVHRWVSEYLGRAAEEYDATDDEGKKVAALWTGARAARAAGSSRGRGVPRPQIRSLPAALTSLEHTSTPS
jgi:trehalose 6-phosphate synthase